MAIQAITSHMCANVALTPKNYDNKLKHGSTSHIGAWITQDCF